MTEQIMVELNERSYPILFGDSFDGLGQALSDFGIGSGRVLVTEEKIYQLFRGELERELRHCPVVFLSGGEQQKTLSAVTMLYRKYKEYGLDRSSVVLALGGGIVGDVAGFSAATYLRGISCVQLPTTLLSQVDSAIGGKTGVNLDGAKNMIGAFYQPRMVFENVGALAKLPEREYRAGLGEIAKYAVLIGEPFLSELEAGAQALLRRDPAMMRRIVARCCRYKAEIVLRDEREEGIRIVLNLGHTFAHAYETATHHRLLHGEAVAAGVLSACVASEKMGLFSQFPRVRRLYAALGLPITVKGVDRRMIFPAMTADKKRSDGEIRFVLPSGFGKAVVTELNKSVLQAAIEEVCHETV